SSLSASMKPAISRATGSRASSSSTSIMSSSAALDPESGSDALSLTSNCRAFSIRKPTFSGEIVSSGIACSSSGHNAERRQMIHCAGTWKPASFPEYRAAEEMPDALERGQGQDHQGHRNGDGRQHPFHIAARDQRGNPETAVAHP